MSSQSQQQQQQQLPPVEELQARREQFEQEVQLLSQSFMQLKEAQDRFVQNIATLTSLKTSTEKEMLVPLTSSVYVSGRLSSKEKVMVDVGTGYFVEKDLKGADEYYVRKVKYLQEQLNMLGKVLSEKRQNLSLITQALQMKLQQHQIQAQ